MDHLPVVKVADVWWNLIKNGHKTIEGRPATHKMSTFSHGTLIRVFNSDRSPDDADAYFHASVKDIRPFENFEQMYKTHGERLLPSSGVPAEYSSAPWMIYSQWYDINQGAVGVELEVIKN